MSSLIPSFWERSDNPMLSLQKEMDRMFREFSDRRPFDTGSGFPAIDVTETETGLEVTAELPGIAEKDVEVSLSDRTLTIKGEKKAEKTVSEKDRHLSERSYGAFRRTMTLPYAPEPGSIDAHMDNGILTIALPRPEETEVGPQKIQVRRKG